MNIDLEKRTQQYNELAEIANEIALALLEHPEISYTDDIRGLLSEWVAKCDQMNPDLVKSVA